MSTNETITRELGFAEAILQRAENDGRDITDAERAQHDIHLQRAENAKTLEKINSGEMKVNREPGFAVPTLVTRNQSDPWNHRDGDSTTGLRARAFDAIERIEAPTSGKDRLAGALSSSLRGDTAELLLAATAPNYESAFTKVIADPVRGHLMWSDAERGAFADVQNARAAMSLTDANGGFLVPFTLDPMVQLTNVGNINPFRSIARSVTTLTEDWNGAVSAGVDAAWVAEGAEVGDGSPTFSRVTITPSKLAAWAFASYELIQDSTISAQLPGILSDAFSVAEGAAFATGSGSGAPKGIVTSLSATTGSRVSATTGGAFGIADVYKLDNALPARARGGNLSWIANRAVINLIRGFDTSGGSSFWANLGQSTSTAPQLLDAQIHEVSAMTSTVTTGSNLLILGNFSDYVIVDRIGTTIVYDENIKGANGRPTGQAGWLGYRRVGADVMNADSFRLLRL